MSRLAVVIPAFDAERTLARAVESVRAQPGPPAAVFVMDDGSRDRTAEVAEGLARRLEGITVVRRPNRGAPAARNAGLVLAEDAGARAVMFLDADDALEGDCLSAGLRHVEAGADLVLSRLVRRSSGGADEALEPPADLSPAALFAGWLSGPQRNPAAMVWRTGFVRAIGGWDEGVLINQDGEIAMRAFAAGARVAANPEGTGIYHVGENAGSLSSVRGPEKLSNYVRTLWRLRETGLAADPPFEVAAIEETLYGVARMSFASGASSTGRKAIRLLKQVGWDGHRGSLPHRIAAGILGLEVKMRLSAALRSVRSG